MSTVPPTPASGRQRPSLPAEKILSVAHGLADLNLFAPARAMLNHLPPESRNGVTVLDLEARIAMRQNNRAQAEKLWRQAVALEPENPLVKAALQELERPTKIPPPHAPAPESVQSRRIPAVWPAAWGLLAAMLAVSVVGLFRTRSAVADLVFALQQREVSERTIVTSLTASIQQHAETAAENTKALAAFSEAARERDGRRSAEIERLSITLEKELEIAGVREVVWSNAQRELQARLVAEAQKTAAAETQLHNLQRDLSAAAKGLEMKIVNLDGANREANAQVASTLHQDLQYEIRLQTLEKQIVKLSRWWVIGVSNAHLKQLTDEVRALRAEQATRRGATP